MGHATACPWIYVFSHPCPVPQAERGCSSRCDGTVWLLPKISQRADFLTVVPLFQTKPIAELNKKYIMRFIIPAIKEILQIVNEIKIT